MDIIKYTKEVLNHIEEIDDIVDSYFEPIKDLTDTAEDIFTPLKIVHSLYTFNRKRKFKSFLKYYALSLKNRDFQKNDNEQLSKYLKNEKNYNFIYDTIDSAINSKSIYGSRILAYFAGIILSEKRDLTFREIIILESLRELNDFELSLFVKVYSVVDLSKTVSIQDYPNQLHNELMYEMMITKMVNLRVFKSAPILGSGRPKASFDSTEIAEDIYFLIEEMDIKNALLKY